MTFSTFVFVLIQIPLTLAHYDAAYFRSAKDSFEAYSNWMKEIDDDVMLSELALPGTHNSGTYTVNSAITANQAIDFEEQLQYGIRVFDIRVRHTSDRFAIHHGPVFLHLMLENFLDAVSEFLIENPSEIVIFRLSKERDDNDNNTRSRKQTLEFYLSQYSSTYKRVRENVKLGNVRGKFMIISYESEFDEFGLSKLLFHTQDQYELKIIWDLYEKWLAVLSHLNEAANGDKSQFYTNYLSASGGVFPYFVASGHSLSGTSAPRMSTGLLDPPFNKKYPDFPRVKCLLGVCGIVFEGTNILARDHIKNATCTRRTLGIIMADFPGTSLIAWIIANNFHHNSCNKNIL